MSNTVEAREAEGKAEICGSLQGFMVSQKLERTSVQCSVVNPARVPVLSYRGSREEKPLPR